ncbi:hypothetical protein [Streptomyces solicathayae]|uniref:Transmembrane protein n=1 Tax=Streptomyces solicathayae TaxID=3081768 RepID=A0ABZ0LVE3_9ACTN|nr:hypothetical protein [Streptomyces sp. HUAS YS2]WOX23310.1 hypothetical protein R2D22_18695 [Streptomyces sp. HUAS YS2]
MHMNVAPHLLTEDRAEFERILDDALRTAHERPDLAEIGKRLNTEQLRTMALNATALIAAAATAEYDHFVKVREDFRSPPSRPSVMDAVLSRGGDEDQDGPGAGFAAVVTVLAPVLAGLAALIFLLSGSVLKAVGAAPEFAGALITAGWFFAAVTAAGLFCAAIGLLVTALRNSSTEVPAQDPGGELPDEVSRAREAWRHALRERGIVPFLRDALADPSAGPSSSGPPHQRSRYPKVGYSGPDFSSPSEGATEIRPAFTSPEFTSPDFTPPDFSTSTESDPEPGQ